MKDSRTMLEDWRRQSTHDDMHAASSANKRDFVEAGTTALERYRMKKLQKLEQAENSLPPSHGFSSGMPPRAVNSAPIFDDDDLTGDYSRVTMGTPAFSRRLAGGGRAARRRSFSVGSRHRARDTSPCLTQDSEASLSQPLSQLTTFSAPTPMITHQPVPEEVNTVEGAGLRSRIQEMQQRVDQLEKEKMVLSMSKAPLEARFRQKEDAWKKEQRRLHLEIDSLMQSSQEADERCRDLAVKCDALQEEVTKLRFAARKAASTLNSHQGDNTVWSRQLQNDRDVIDLKDKLRNAEEEIRHLRLEKVSVEKEVNATKMELDSLIRSYDELQAEYDEVAASKSEDKEAEIKLEVLTMEHIATAAQLNAVCADLAATKARTDAAMEEKDNEHKKEVAQLQFHMSVLKTRASKAVNDDKQSRPSDEEDDAVLRARIEARDRRIIELEAALLNGEQIRRQMHNRIQELRGNIRVFVRTRPFLPGDGAHLDSSIEVCPDGENMSIVDHRGGGDHGFKFDKVFPPSAGQDQVFNEVADFVQSALDGYHVCLFSYGQTGSGKTHTMQGSGKGVMRGIIPRAVEQILSQVLLMQNQKWEFTLSASFLEIYNEELKDLLANLRSDGRPVQADKLSIKRDRDGKSYVDGLAEVPIDGRDADVGMGQLANLMESAARSRSVASTKMNAQSSRSHSVFMLHLRGYNEDSGAVVHGALNLCDLAGSERLDRSGAGTDAKRLKETQAINKSLSCLGDVFNALATGASHVPYRNSKLTYLLQDCLSGDGKALMFVNLSPTLESSNESLCSLRFAQRVNSVELGKPTKNIQYSKVGKR